jgi:hypothetical protein
MKFEKPSRLVKSSPDRRGTRKNPDSIPRRRWVDMILVDSRRGDEYVGVNSVGALADALSL